MTRHNISMSDELWGKVQRAALDAGVKRGRAMSASEFLRELIHKELGTGTLTDAADNPSEDE